MNQAKRVDSDQGFLIAIAHVEVRWWMVVVVHGNHNPKKAADCRHITLRAEVLAVFHLRADISHAELFAQHHDLAAQHRHRHIDRAELRDRNGQIVFLVRAN